MNRPAPLLFLPWHVRSAASPSVRASALGKRMSWTASTSGGARWRETSSDPTAERTRLNLAMAGARNEIVHLSQRISELVGEDHGAILQAQLMIMQDRTIENDLNACLDAGASAERRCCKPSTNTLPRFRN